MRRSVLSFSYFPPPPPKPPWEGRVRFSHPQIPAGTSAGMDVPPAWLGRDLEVTAVPGGGAPGAPPCHPHGGSPFPHHFHGNPYFSQRWLVGRALWVRASLGKSRLSREDALGKTRSGAPLPPVGVGEEPSKKPKTFAFSPPRRKTDLYFRKILKHGDPPPIPNELLTNLKRAAPKGSDPGRVLSAAAVPAACRASLQVQGVIYFPDFFYFPVIYFPLGPQITE